MAIWSLPMFTWHIFIYLIWTNFVNVSILLNELVIFKDILLIKYSTWPSYQINYINFRSFSATDTLKKLMFLGVSMSFAYIHRSESCFCLNNFSMMFPTMFSVIVEIYEGGYSRDCSTQFFSFNRLIFVLQRFFS